MPGGTTRSGVVPHSIGSHTKPPKHRKGNSPRRWWAVAALSVSPGARAYYDQRRAAGDTHDAALRHLASKLIGQLHHCLAHRLLATRKPPGPSPKTTKTASRLTQRGRGVSRRAPSRQPVRRVRALGRPRTYSPFRRGLIASTAVGPTDHIGGSARVLPRTFRSLSVMRSVGCGYPADRGRSRPALNGRVHASEACVPSVQTHPPDL